MHNILLNIDNISVTYYGGYSGVSSANLIIPEGSLVSIVGSHGSGKSSLLKAIGGLENYSGSITYNNRNLKSISIKNRNFGLTFTEDSLNRRDSVEKCLAYPMVIRKCYTRAQIKERVADVAAEWGLSSCLRTQVGLLSNVSRSAVILARTFVVSKDLYMLDNPLINTFGSERDELLALLSKSLRKHSSTVIFATDSMREAMALSPDIYAIIENGILADSGMAHDIYRDPSSIAVARTVSGGLINNLSATVNKGNITLLGTSIDMSARLMSDNFTSASVVIYYTDIKINHKGKYSGIILSKYDYVLSSTLTVKSCDDIITIVTEYTKLIAIGDVVHYDIDKDKIYLFDTMSELSIIK